MSALTLEVAERRDQGAVDSVCDIHTDEDALRAALKIAGEYGEGIFNWFKSRTEKYNFVGDPEAESGSENAQGLCTSFWAAIPTEEIGKDGKPLMKRVFGGTFVVVCREVVGYERSKMKFRVVTRRFPINKPEPNRKYY